MSGTYGNFCKLCKVASKRTEIIKSLNYLQKFVNLLNCVKFIAACKHFSLRNAFRWNVLMHISTKCLKCVDAMKFIEVRNIDLPMCYYDMRRLRVRRLCKENTRGS